MSLLFSKHKEVGHFKYYLLSQLPKGNMTCEQYTLCPSTVHLAVKRTQWLSFYLKDIDSEYNVRPSL